VGLTGGRRHHHHSIYCVGGMAGQPKHSVTLPQPVAPSCISVRTAVYGGLWLCSVFGPVCP